MKKLIHIIEGTTLEMELEGGERAVTFAANIVDDYVELDAEGLLILMQHCHKDSAPNLTVEDVQRMMDAGSDTFVIEHLGNRSLMHFIKAEG